LDYSRYLSANLDAILSALGDEKPDSAADILKPLDHALDMIFRESHGPTGSDLLLRAPEFAAVLESSRRQTAPEKGNDTFSLAESVLQTISFASPILDRAKARLPRTAELENAYLDHIRSASTAVAAFVTEQRLAAAFALGPLHLYADLRASLFSSGDHRQLESVLREPATRLEVVAVFAEDGIELPPPPSGSELV